MKKGLFALFAAVTLCASTTFALAPVVSQLPDIQIGDAEDNNVSTDNNFFVFTNAFKFDDKVNDPDSPDKSLLLWSFDEGDPAATQYFTVNNLNPVHQGATQMAQDGVDGGAAHQNPTGKNVRLGNEWATFRDQVFSPGTGPLTSGFPDPAVASHSKVVQFWVSDGANVTPSNQIVVSSVDNALDATSGGSDFTVRITESCTTNTSWYPTGHSHSSVMGGGVDYENILGSSGALRLRTYTAGTYTNGEVRYRLGMWQALDAPDVLLYSTIGADKVARAKFSIYADGQATSNKNQIPAFTLRLSTGYQVTSILEVTPHLNSMAGFPGYEAKYMELAPSTNSSAPSVYRVDHDPIETSYLTANADNVQLATRPCFAIMACDPQDNGYINMSECVTGTYPRALIPDSATPVKTYGLADLNPGLTDPKIVSVGYNVIPGTLEGSLGTGEMTGNIPTITYNASTGVTHSSTAVATTRIGVTNYNPSDTRGGALPQSQIARVAPGKQYKVTFTVSSTGQVNRQAGFWLYTHTIDYGYVMKTEFAGSYVIGGSGNPATDYASPDNAYGRTVLPSTGDDITDNKYDVLIYTPLSTDIGAQPLLLAEPGFGSTSTSLRDINPGLFGMDTLNWGTPGFEYEVMNLTLSNIDIREYNAVLD